MYKQLIDNLFALGAQKGFEAQEIYMLKSKNVEISVYDGEIDKYNLSEDGGVSYRGIAGGKMGYAYTEILDESQLQMLVDEAFGNATVIESEDKVFLHDGTGDYATLDNFNPSLSTVPMKEKIDFMLALEAKVKAFDPRIKSITHNSYDEVETYRWIKNTKGLDVEDRVNYCLAYAMPVATDGEDTRTGIGYAISNDFYELSLDKIAEESALDALQMLGAKSLKSKKCPVVIKNETFTQLFSAYMGLFSAERVQKNLSSMAGKLDSLIASEVLTLVDNPHLHKALASSRFDAEGVATSKKAIIEKGVLKTFLHNLKTAAKDGVESTGNASKGSYKGTIGISASNLIIQPGTLSFDALLNGIEDGVYVTSLQGLHAGIDPISGDFSLQCSGFAIASGKCTYPVSKITVAGNFFELLKNIEAFADDFKFSIFSADYMGSASCKINGLTISGE